MKLATLLFASAAITATVTALPVNIRRCVTAACMTAALLNLSAAASVEPRNRKLLVSDGGNYDSSAIDNYYALDDEASPLFTMNGNDWVSGGTSDESSAIDKYYTLDDDATSLFTHDRFARSLREIETAYSGMRSALIHHRHGLGKVPRDENGCVICVPEKLVCDCNQNELCETMPQTCDRCGKCIKKLLGRPPIRRSPQKPSKPLPRSPQKPSKPLPPSPQKPSKPLPPSPKLPPSPVHGHPIPASPQRLPPSPVIIHPLPNSPQNLPPSPVHGHPIPASPQRLPPSPVIIHPLPKSPQNLPPSPVIIHPLPKSPQSLPPSPHRKLKPSPPKPINHRPEDFDEEEP